MKAQETFSVKNLKQWPKQRATAIWENLLKNHLWQRMLKNTLATTIAIIIAIIPAVVRIYGPAAYLAPITTVFGHPGRRFGEMAEALVLTMAGTLLGIAWSMLAIYLSSLVYEYNEPASYTVKGIFLAFSLLFHGYLRSHSPRLFIFVLLLVIVTVVSLTGRATSVSAPLVTALLYPILTAVAVLLLVNVFVFPEFSSDFLGTTTIETLGEAVAALRDAGRYFVTLDNEPIRGDSTTDGSRLAETVTKTAAEKPTETARHNDSSLLQKIIRAFKLAPSKPGRGQSIKPVKLKDLTDKKTELRAKLASCKAAQLECNFELAWAVIPPRDLKPISNTAMKKLVASTISLIGTCENKYALLGDQDDKSESETKEEHHFTEMAKEANLEDDKTIQSRPQTPNVIVSDDHSDNDASQTRDNTDSIWRWRKKAKDRNKSRSQSRSRSKGGLEREKEDLELVKPKKEIEFADTDLLKYLVSHISIPLANLQEKIDRSVDVVTSCLAYTYDVKKLPSGSLAPTGIKLEEIDIRVDILANALSDFDRESAAALEACAILNNLDEPQVMPRMETFLISSFLLNLRQAGQHTLDMLKHSRVLVEKRQARHGRGRLYLPEIKWRKWLASGGEKDALALPAGGRKEIRTGVAISRGKGKKDKDQAPGSNESLLNTADIETGHSAINPRPTLSKAEKSNNNVKTKPKKKESINHRARHGLADCLEYLAKSEDVLYAIKLTVAVFLVTFPAFVAKWNTWFYQIRGLWAALQLVLVTEVAIGTSVWTFMLRAVGTTLGCLWGWAAYESSHGNRVVCVIILVIGIIPSTYIQLGSKYIKAGMVSIISMSIVALAIMDASMQEAPAETFLKRFVAFLIGGIVALVIEVILFPVRARDRLVECLASSIQQISEMEACVAVGIELEANINDIQSYAVSKRFDRAKRKAEAALAAAAAFLPFCSQEPRLKGSFKGHALIYAEILYVLHAILDKMGNMLHLRYAYGSGVLEELNSQVHPYRRNVAASVTLVLFAVHEALTTKLPLPQFLPSARIAHLRMVNRVREVVIENGPDGLEDVGNSTSHGRNSIEMIVVKRLVRKKFLAWNAASAGQIEVIEYLEELIDLAKLLVGANEFRSGMLTRPTYRDYVDRFDRQSREEAREQNQEEEKDDGEARDTMPEPDISMGGLKKRRTTVSKAQDATRKKDPAAIEENGTSQRKSGQDELPGPLQRVRSRRIEELNLQKTRSVEQESKKGKSGKDT